MRISDWSSDVCSSDLDRKRVGPPTERKGKPQGTARAQRGGAAMTRAVAPHIADSLCEIWSTLHQGENFSFLRDERHYLQQIVLSADCDLVSGLLSRKLRIAKVWNAQLIPSDVVTMNSCIEYYHGSARLPRFCQQIGRAHV